MSNRPLRPSQLYRRCNLKQISFTTTADLEPLADVLGQQRALEALDVAFGVRRDGYNIYAMGPMGLGKHGVVTRFIEQNRRAQPVPDEWCYLHNFDDPKKPRALRLPAGMSKRLVTDMDQLVTELRSAIAAALESDEFRARRDAIEDEFKDQHEKELRGIQQQAKKHGIAMIHTPAGVGFAPTEKGEVIRPAQFGKLSAAKKKKLEQVVTALQSQLQELMQKVPRRIRESRRRLKDLSREVITVAVKEPIDELRKRYGEVPTVLEHLDAVRCDVIEHASSFTQSSEESAPTALAQRLPGQSAGTTPGSTPYERYTVNLLVDQSKTEGAPVIHEVNPSYHNLVGQVEHVSHMGALVTDFRLIKPGALHRANGGYLLLDTRRLLLQPFAYEALKQALRTRQIRIESLGQLLSLISTVSLEPEPIPLDVKVVLVGDRLLYYLLCQLDPDFSDLFKIGADFAEDIDWTDEQVPLYARLVATLASKNELRPLGRRAVARVIEHGARLCGDSQKLTIRVESVADLLREADYWCAQAGKQVVSDEHVQRAIDAQIYRNSRVRERIHEEMVRETMLIDTEGEEVGQVNGLSVLQLGSYAFGRPSRITATVRLGKGEVMDIEREVQLGGPLHAKGVLILGGFLGARFGQRGPLALTARLVFEQSYGGIEGDSASSAELFALLSALADLPIRQGLAVTGSVNQRGQIQAIGGVNEKIEGFFDLCETRELTGQHGVLIPQANVKHLMLARRVVDAVKQKRFHVHAVSTVDEAMELLTGARAGTRGEDGRYPPDTINGRIERRLDSMAERVRAFARPPAALGTDKQRDQGSK